MENTVREKILDNIKTTVEGITQANGYGNDMVSVQRYEQAGNQYNQVPCTIIYAGPEKPSQMPGDKLSRKFTVMLDIYAIHNTTTHPGSTDSYLNNLLGDVIKALMTDYTRGGYAVNTRIMSVDQFESVQGEPYTGLWIDVDIEYRTNLTDPTAAV